MVTLDQAGAARSRTRVIGPPPSLLAMVEHLWIQRLPAGREHIGWRIVPDGSAHVIVGRPRRSSECTESFVVGARTRWVDGRSPARRWSVGARLRPGALAVLFRTPAIDLTDRAAPLLDLLGARPPEAALRLPALRTPERALRALVEALEVVARRADPVDWKVRGFADRVASTGARVGVTDIGSALGIAPRTLRAVLRSEAGLTPRRFVRIRRLHGAVTDALESPPNSPRSALARVAARAGYCDAPHLVREFRALMGETPSAFLARAGSFADGPAAGPAAPSSSP